MSLSNGNPYPRWAYWLAIVQSVTLGATFSVGIFTHYIPPLAKAPFAFIAIIWLAVAAQSLERIFNPLRAQNRPASLTLPTCRFLARAARIVTLAACIGAFLSVYLHHFGSTAGDYSWRAFGDDLRISSYSLMMGSLALFDFMGVRSGQNAPHEPVITPRQIRPW